MRLIAVQSFNYMAGALQLRPGDRFVASSAEDARLLKAWGRAVDDAGEVAAIHARKPGKGRYNRSDMRAAG
jgi:hypothetical protein